MSVLQHSCPKVEALSSSSALTVVFVPFSRSELWRDTSTGILPPETIRMLVFNTIHSVLLRITREDSKKVADYEAKRTEQEILDEKLANKLVSLPLLK